MNWEKLIPSAIIFLFPLFWIGISYVISHMGGGWRRLARDFPDDGLHLSSPIRSAWMRPGRFGLINYNSCLNIGIYEAGFRLSVLPLFWAGHPPLFIPWGAMANAREKRVLIWRYLQIEVGDSQPVTVLLPGWVGEYCLVMNDE